MKIERGVCTSCRQKTVERAGETSRGRPIYRCQDGKCGCEYMLGDAGEPWDTQPAPTRAT